MTTIAIRTRLDELEAEAAAAAAWGADGIASYAADLRREIEHYRNAYVGAAVTEIASLRAELSGPLFG